jgi:hypothetical protein
MIKTPEGKEQYDEEPVFYCKRCLSLNIRQIPGAEDQEYCDDCGSANIGSASIEEWEEMYRKKNGKDYVVKRELKWPYWC